MNISWQYPLYLIPIQGGFASVSDNDSSEPDQSLIVFSSDAAAVLFISHFNLLSAPKAIQNDRELSWLLHGLKPPVTRMLLDANPANPESKSGQLFTVKEVLSTLKPDLSPWDYPVYAIATDVGFVTIDGAAADGEFLSAIAFFTSQEKAHQYLESSGDTGETCEIKNRIDANIFLRGVSKMVGAVAIDPIVEGNKHSAKYCFSVETLLNKYLIGSDQSND